jgi:hypothetical protein
VALCGGKAAEIAPTKKVSLTLYDICSGDFCDLADHKDR